MANSRQKRKEKTKAYVVFISHSSRDAWIAGQIGEEIEALGAKKWLDKHDLQGGDEVLNKIIAGIRASREVILLLSPESVKSHWVSIEIGAALGRRKRVTPILYNLSPREMGPLQGIKAIRLNDFDDFLIELKGRIDKWLISEK
jgi:TIR domain